MDENHNDPQWERKDLHWRDERRKADDQMYQVKGVLLLMLLAAVIIANVLLVSGVQLMTTFTYPEAEAVLEGFPEHTQLDSEAQKGMASFLLQTPAGRPLLVTAEKHFLFDRWQLLSEENTVDTLTIIRGDCWSASVSAVATDITDYSVTAIGLDSNIAGLPDVIPFRVLIYSGILTALELGLWTLVQKLRRM